MPKKLRLSNEKCRCDFCKKVFPTTDAQTAVADADKFFWLFCSEEHREKWVLINHHRALLLVSVH